MITFAKKHVGAYLSMVKINHMLVIPSIPPTPTPDYVQFLCFACQYGRKVANAVPEGVFTLPVL